MVLAVDDVVARCRAALAEHTPMLAVRDALEELIVEPDALERAIGPVEIGGITALHNEADLTVSESNAHPNAKGHRMIADGLYAELLKRPSLIGAEGAGSSPRRP